MMTKYSEDIMTTHTDDQIQRDTEALALPGGRKVGTPGHEVARRYLLT